MKTTKTESTRSKASSLEPGELTYSRFSKAFVSDLWPWYLGGLIFLALTNLVTVQIPKLAGKVTDEFGKTDLETLSNWALLIIILGILQIFCRSLSRILIFWPGRAVEAKSRAAMFGHTIRLSREVLNQFATGDLISRLSNDLGQLRVFFAFGILQVFNLVFLTIFTISQMWQLSPALTVTALSPLTMMFILTKLFIPKLQKYNKLNQEAMAQLTSSITETFTNIHLIKSGGAAASFQKRNLPYIENVYHANIRVIILRTILFPLISSLSSIAQVATLFYGGFMVLENQLKVGDILAFNIYIGTLAFPLTSIGIILSIYQRGKVALERLSEVSSKTPEIGRQEPKIRVSSKALIEVKNLTFAYSKNQNRFEVLKNIEMKVQKGEKVGLVGAVGSGKSTLLNLLARIYTPPTNSVFFMGLDINLVKPDFLRSNINYALQTPHFFSKSIESNLQFGLGRQLQLAELEAATDKSAIQTEIKALPMDWSTQVGEKGIRLSGGQKQRLALSRLFLRKSDIWLLDDVMSAVDTETESLMVESLFTEENTLIISSHRPRALSKCDYVIYLKDGKIEDIGSYTELRQKHVELEEFIHEKS